MIRIKGTEWDRATCAAEAASRIGAGELSEPDNHSLDFALWSLALLNENARLRAERATLIEQLRQACSVAFDDLLAQYLVQTETEKCTSKMASGPSLEEPL